MIDACGKPVEAKALDPNVWGFSVWRRQPGFRTLGLPYSEWAKRHKVCELFGSQADALAEMARLTKLPAVCE